VKDATISGEYLQCWTNLEYNKGEGCNHIWGVSTMLDNLQVGVPSNEHKEKKSI
jgi:hypothetical protein